MSFARQALILFFLLAVGSGVSASSDSSLTAVGVALPSRLYRNWFAQITGSGGPEVSFRPVSSAEAQWALIRQAVDFAVSDAPLQPRDLAKVRRGVVQIPIAAEAITFGYNQPGCDLKLTQQQAVQVASGRITDWKQLGCKPGALTWVHRSDASGTTEAFSQSMQAFSSQWLLGTGQSIRWPAANAIAAEGNSGVAAAIENRRGAIGYLGVSHLSGSLRAAALQNKAGEFLRPSVVSSAQTLKGIELDFNLAGSNPNPLAQGAYPIVTLIWGLAYRSGNGDNTQAVRAALDFMLSSQAQGQVAELGLIPLETEILSKSRPVIERISQ
ncbi:PstS family phosphate ABC transporter substrate-binding protein [Synechococcus sp. UW179A]|uniref:PstS family phosphate ABC transporter substrate-binding protein n=1 Tax=Synechococcus sp. UW179A TaxID=2575510 RepID=UPI000E0E2A09|nr:substrate-binding domain-containing protein [Synechococcus sp. UW179A]